jgi:hypothetical protein
MQILFKKINTLTEKAAERDKETAALREKVRVLEEAKEVVAVHNGDSYNNNNITNIQQNQLNFNVFGTGTAIEDDTIKEILMGNAARILGRAPDHSPPEDQRTERVCEVMTTVYRNPEYPSMQNVYVTDIKAKGNNAFKYYNGEWRPCDWSRVSTSMLSRLWGILVDNRSKMVKKDELRIISCLAEMTGKTNLETVTNILIKDIYAEMGRRLSFESIIQPVAQADQANQIEPVNQVDQVKAIPPQRTSMMPPRLPPLPPAPRFGIP